MIKADLLTKALTKDGSARAYVLNSKNTVAKAFEIHKTSPVVTVALGRVLTAASMMGAMLKDEDGSITLSFAGGGAAGNIVAVSDCGGNVRGYAVNPIVDVPLNAKGQLNVKAAVGIYGSLSVIKQMGNGKSYNGTVPIDSGEIAEDITSYFSVSEQTPTVCALETSVKEDWSVKSAGGFLVQLMPGADDAVVDLLERNIEDIGSIKNLFEGGLSNEEILSKIFSGIEFEVLSEQKVEYMCTCSEERTKKAILSLGKKDLAELAAKLENIETTCHFCGRTYRFPAKEILALTDEKE